MQIANEILRQLGGPGRLGVMINAKILVGLPDGLRFKHMKGKNGANMAEIRLNARDLYDVRFLKARGLDCAEVAKVEDAYVDMLPAIFRDEAGLTIRL